MIIYLFNEVSRSSSQAANSYQRAALGIWVTEKLGPQWNLCKLPHILYLCCRLADWPHAAPHMIGDNSIEFACLRLHFYRINAI